jgi:hypothetical protein
MRKHLASRAGRDDVAALVVEAGEDIGFIHGWSSVGLPAIFR